MREAELTVSRDIHGAIRHVCLIAHGDPKTQGSKKHVGKGVFVEAVNGLEDWRDQIAAITRNVMRDAEVPVLMGPVEASLDFYFRYRQGDLRANGEPKPTAPEYQSARQDIDKLSRAVLDAIVRGGLIEDDGQVSVLLAQKRYAPNAGVRITIRPL